MNLPIPWGVIGRIWMALKENPCTIEVVEGRDGGQWVRIRNDSKLPVQLFNVSFQWRLKGESDFSVFSTPMAWLLSKHTDEALEPGNSFEHPIDVHELGQPVAECIISVRHNRQPKPEEKRFVVKA